MSAPANRAVDRPPSPPRSIEPYVVRIPAWRLAVVLLTAAAWIALGEIDRMIGQAVDTTGETATVTSLLGLAAWSERGAWQTWAGTDPSFGVADLLLMYGVVELVFVAALATSVAALAAGTRESWRSPRCLALRWVLSVLVLVELAEAAVFLRLTATLADAGSSEVWALRLAYVTYVKWSVVALVVLTVLGSHALRRRLAQQARRLVPALWHQRLSVLVVAAYVGTTLLPGAGVPDQFPDVLRSWVSQDLQVPWHAVVAVVTSLVVSAALLWTGRFRSGTEHLRYVGCEPPPASRPSFLWLLPAAAAAVAACVLWVTGNGELVDMRPLVGFTGAVVGLWVVSYLLHLDKVEVHRVEAPVRSDPVRALYAYVVGDTLAISFFALGAVAFVRALTAPTALYLARGGTDQVAQGMRYALLLGAVLVVVLWPYLAKTVLGRGGWVIYPDEAGWRYVAVPGLAAAGLLGMTVLPVLAADLLGVAAVTFLALACWVVLLTAFVVHLSLRQPMQVFALVGARSAPVLSLFVVLPFVVSMGGGDRDLHAVTTTGPAGPTERADVETAFTSWFADGEACDRETTRPGVDARPLLLVAAQGGGIRAAVWTAHGMAGLDRSCARQAVLLSSGISGGSVGLVAARSSDPVAVTEDMSQPVGLGAAVTGLLVGDAVGGATGVRVPSVGQGLPWGWRDRATLMEDSWATTPRSQEETDAWSPLLAPWDPGSTTLVDGAVEDVDFQRPTGALVLNSAATGTGCRVVLSQLDLATADPPVDQNCRDRSATPPVTLDYHDTFGTCLLGSRWLTMSMISARFPTVTPAARAPLAGGDECQEVADLQLVDGGYAESSGLGTLVDVAPQVMAAVTQHNEDVMSAGEGSLVVPFVVYLRNAPGGDLAEVSPPLSTELLVPLAGLAARDAQLSEGAWLQRLEQQLVDPCPATTTEELCSEAVDQLRDPVDGVVVVVGPSTQPAVDAPLGWTLSPGSRTLLEKAMTGQVEECPGGQEKRDRAYGCFGNLLAVLDPASP